MPVGLMEPLSGTNMTPLAQLPGGGQAEIGGDQVWDLKRPEIDSGSYAYWAGRLGPRGAENWKNEQLAGWKSQVAAFMSDQLLNGRPQTKPLSMDEVSGLLNRVAPSLAADKGFMSRIGLWAKMWNDEAIHLRKAEAQRAGNLYESGEKLGAEYLPEQRALMDSHGYLVRGPQTALAASPGVLDPQPTSQTAGSPKKDLFAGYFPSPAQREAEKISITSKPAAEKARLTARAQQDEQTRGHKERYRFDQLNPKGSWATKTDPQTGMQTKAWTGDQREVELGRKPLSVSDHEAQIMTKALTAATQGQDPKTVLNPTELQIFESALRGGVVDEFIKKLMMDKAGLQAKSLPGETSAQAKPQTAAQPATNDVPPMPGARKARDGHWYVMKDGKWNRVEP